MSDPADGKATVRCFVAAEVPDAVASAAASVQECLRRSGVRARWVPRTHFHLTLRFLGEQPARRIPDLEAAMGEAARRVEPFPLAAEGIGVFPGRGAPRVLWLGLSGAVDALGRLQRILEGTLEERLGIAGEGRPFHGHLTLARFKDRVSRRRIEEAASACRPPAPEPFRVDRLCLFESRLSPRGARYVRLAEAGLAGR